MPADAGFTLLKSVRFRINWNSNQPSGQIAQRSGAAYVLIFTDSFGKFAVSLRDLLKNVITVDKLQERILLLPSTFSTLLSTMI